jgi:hypothetical protein
MIMWATIWPPVPSFDRLGSATLRFTPSSFLDFPRNVALFAPFGASLGLRRKTAAKSHGVLSALLSGLLLSGVIEAYQFVLPHREPNVSDLIANSVGTGCGWALVRAFESWSVVYGAIQKRVYVVAVAYVVAVTSAVCCLSCGVRPRGWNPSYRLAIGNEVNGQEPWTGRIANVVVFDRALGEAITQELLAGRIPETVDGAVVGLYSLTDETSLRDERGHLPTLDPQAATTPIFSRFGAVIGNGRWFATTTAAETLADRVNQTHQFGLAFSATTEHAAREFGPIVTFSDGLSHRNLTIAQKGTDLAVCWRAPLTGDNGDNPVIRFPNIFATRGQQRIVVSSDGSVVTVSTSRGERARVFMVPGLASQAIVREGSHWTFSADDTKPRDIRFVFPVFLIVVGLAVLFAATRPHLFVTLLTKR